MSSEINKAIVRRLVDEGTNQNNYAVFDELIAPNVIDHTAQSGQPQGVDAVKQGHHAFKTAFPDAYSTIEEMIAEGELVAYRIRMQATNTGPFMEQPPTGNVFIGGGMNMVRIVNGQLVEHWSFLDTLGMLQQLGLLHLPVTMQIGGSIPPQ